MLVSAARVRKGGTWLEVPAFTALCCAVVLAPFVSVGVPGLGDTVNHLARMHVLAAAGRSPALRQFYEVHWTAIPYLAMDLVVPPLLSVLPVYVAGKVFAIACILLPVAGTASMHFVLHRRVSLVPCAAFLVSTNILLSLGFLNFLFSAGLALLLFAGWVASASWPRWRRAALFAPAVLVLYFGHAFACAAYCLAVGGFEIARAAGSRPKVWRVTAADFAAALAQAVPALVFAATLNVASGYLGPLHTRYGTTGDKVAALFSPFLFLNDGWQRGLALAAVLLGLALAFRCRISGPGGGAALAVAGAAVATPHVLASTWGTDLRFPLMAVLLLIASVRLELGPRARLALAGCFVALLVAKSADAWVPMHRADAAFRETRLVLDALPVGARLMVVNPSGHGTGREQIPISTIWHMPLVAVIDRDAFVPTLFSGLTTVRVRPAFRAASTPNGLPVSPAQLWEGLSHHEDGMEHDDGEGARLYHFGWPEKFDYVLVQHFGAGAGKLPDNLVRVTGSADMDLYRVESVLQPPSSAAR